MANKAIGVAAFLRQEQAKRGWNDAKLSEMSGIKPAALSNIFRTPDIKPKLDTLGQLAQALARTTDEYPRWLSKLIASCGYPEYYNSQCDVQELISELPELVDLQEYIDRIPPEMLGLIRGYIRSVLDQSIAMKE